MTLEFDKWASGTDDHADRLDLLGFGADGRSGVEPRGLVQLFGRGVV